MHMNHQPNSLRYRLLQEDQVEMTLECYIEDIKNEIQALLNQISSTENIPSNLVQLKKSILNYGVSENIRWSAVEAFQNVNLLNDLANLIMNNDSRINNCRIYLQDMVESSQSIELIILGEIHFYRKKARLQLNAKCQPIQRRFYLS